MLCDPKRQEILAGGDHLVSSWSLSFEKWVHQPSCEGRVDTHRCLSPTDGQGTGCVNGPEGEDEKASTAAELWLLESRWTDRIRNVSKKTESQVRSKDS